MSQDYFRRIIERTSSVPSVISDLYEDSDDDDDHRANYSGHVQRHLSTVSKIHLPRGHEYYPQERVPPTGSEAQQPFILKRVEDDQYPDEHRRPSIIIPVYRKKGKKLDKKNSKNIFFLEPIIGGLILFPITALFWESEWNLVDIILNLLNKLPPDFNSQETPSYTWKSFVCPYLICSPFLLSYDSIEYCIHFGYSLLTKK